jgi:hypothetical protein
MCVVGIILSTCIWALIYMFDVLRRDVKAIQECLSHRKE